MKETEKEKVIEVEREKEAGKLKEREIERKKVNG